MNLFVIHLEYQVSYLQNLIFYINNILCVIAEDQKYHLCECLIFENREAYEVMEKTHRISVKIPFLDHRSILYERSGC